VTRAAGGLDVTPELSGDGLVELIGVLIGVCLGAFGVLAGVGFERFEVVIDGGAGGRTLVSGSGARHTFQWGSLEGGGALKGTEPNAGTCGAC